jgi:choline dehydrogenase-like flavoprotein
VERFDVVVVGGGTAGCVVAGRLTEDPDRRACLIEAGPDYGPLADGRWPEDMLNARILPSSHDWGTGGEDNRSLGARIIGGCSAHNACCVLAGAPADYDAWGPEWTHADVEPYLRRANAELRTSPTNTSRPAPFHVAFRDAAQAAGFALLADPDDPAQPVGIAPIPANAVDGIRWNAALAYLDPARGRPNLTILADTLVDRVVLDGDRATGVVAGGRELQADTVVLAAGAYFTPAILMRSGIGPEEELAAHGIRVAAALPVGTPLLDHIGSGAAWEPSEELQAATAVHDAEAPMFEPHLVLKAASRSCPEGSWDIHLLSWTNPTERGRYEVSCGFFLMDARSSGRVRLRSADPTDLPVIERGFFSDPADLPPLLEALELVRLLARTEPLWSLLAGEKRPGDVDPETYLRGSARNYFHPAGTCAIGSVVDRGARVLGYENLLVADASVMPRIPRANTNLTVVAVAERIADLLRAV